MYTVCLGNEGEEKTGVGLKSLLKVFSGNICNVMFEAEGTTVRVHGRSRDGAWGPCPAKNLKSDKFILISYI